MVLRDASASKKTFRVGEPRQRGWASVSNSCSHKVVRRHDDWGTQYSRISFTPGFAIHIRVKGGLMILIILTITYIYQLKYDITAMWHIEPIHSKWNFDFCLQFFFTTTAARWFGFCKPEVLRASMDNGPAAFLIGNQWRENQSRVWEILTQYLVGNELQEISIKL